MTAPDRTPWYQLPPTARLAYLQFRLGAAGAGIVRAYERLTTQPAARPMSAPEKISLRQGATAEWPAVDVPPMYERDAHLAPWPEHADDDTQAIPLRRRRTPRWMPTRRDRRAA